MKIPKDLRGRLADVGKKNGHASADAFALHLVERGLARLGAGEGELDARLERAVDERGYSSREELIEHLLETGLDAYDAPDLDPEKLKARLRGLGYID
jgi:hypothetical protein